MTQEFHLSITPLGQDRYLVRTEEVAPGVPLAEEQVTWPVDTWLQQSDAQAHDPLMSLLEGDNLSGSRAAVDAPVDRIVESSQLMALGQTLYSALFQGRIRDSWLAAQGVAQNRRQVLRLRLGFKDSRLQRLPWEVLYGDERPLATGTDIVFARYYVTSGLTDMAAMPLLPSEGQTLRVLMVVSAPDDQERLALRYEVQRLKEELHTAPESNPPEADTGGVRSHDIQLVILEQPGRAELVQALEQGQYQVLHYAGHSDVSETGGDLFLVSRQTGLTERLSGEDLAGLLVNNGIRLAVFNSCRGAYTATDDAEAGWREQNLVQALVNRGVPGVIAMAERIPDDVAITFTQLLYRNLKQGHAIDLSLSRTRQGLVSTYGSDQSYWMLPILYLHPEFDGYLFAGDPVPESWPDAVVPGALESWLLDDDSNGQGNGSWRAQTQAEAVSLQDLLEEIAPADTLENGLADQRPEDAQGPSSDTDFNDLLGTLQGDDGPTYEEDAAIVTDLIQQLSTTPTYELPLEASREESLLPDQEVLPLRLQRQSSPLKDPEKSPAAQDSSSVGASHSPADQVAAHRARPGSGAEDRSNSLGSQPRKRWPALSWLVWASLGSIGAIAAALLALFVTSDTWSGSVALPPLAPTAPDASNSSVPTGSLVTGAIQAVTTNNLDVARNLLERLLENGEFQSVQVVLDNASPTQLGSAELSYIRGRLGWEQLAQGSDTSLEDVRRAWQQAVAANPEFVDGWTALGFAHYSLDESQSAIDAWNQAVTLDRQQVRDGEPGRDAIANQQTLNARAGLAMAYDQLSQIAATPNEKAQLQSQAVEQYEFLAKTEPTMLSTQRLSSDWLWQPNLLSDWKNTVENLATAGSSATTAP